MVLYRLITPEHLCPFLHTPLYISTASYKRDKNIENLPVSYSKEGNYMRILFYPLNRESFPLLDWCARCLISLVLVWDICLEILKCLAVQPFFKVNSMLFLVVSSDLCSNTFSYRNSSFFVASKPRQWLCPWTERWSFSVWPTKMKQEMPPSANNCINWTRTNAAIWAWVYLVKRNPIRIQDQSVSSRLALF